MFLAVMGQFHVTEWKKCENDSSMFRVIRTDYHAGRIFIPHRSFWHNTLMQRFSTCGPRPMVGRGPLPGGPRPRMGIEKFFYVGDVSQSMKRYQVLVVELELTLHSLANVNHLRRLGYVT